jgi:hypothetical protein
VPEIVHPIASSVRAELARAGKSGRQLATEMEWHYPHLARRLSGDVEFSAAEVARIAAHLHLPIARLFGPPLDRQAS